MAYAFLFAIQEQPLVSTPDGLGGHVHQTGLHTSQLDRNDMGVFVLPSRNTLPSGDDLARV